jgi:hypothetical protein
MTPSCQRHPRISSNTDNAAFWQAPGGNLRVPKEAIHQHSRVLDRQRWQYEAWQKGEIAILLIHGSVRKAREVKADADSQGISLPLEQYNALLKAIPAINAELIAQGLDVAEIPSGAPSKATEKPSSDKKSKKSNIEETSDEDEDED